MWRVEVHSCRDNCNGCAISDCQTKKNVICVRSEWILSGNLKWVTHPNDQLRSIAIRMSLLHPLPTVWFEMDGQAFELPCWRGSCNFTLHSTFFMAHETRQSTHPLQCLNLHLKLYFLFFSLHSLNLTWVKFSLHLQWSSHVARESAAD